MADQTIVYVEISVTDTAETPSTYQTIEPVNPFEAVGIPGFRDELNRMGMSIGQFNRATNPLGASNHFSAWVLMDQETVEEILSNNLDSWVALAVRLKIGPLTFEELRFRPPVGIVCPEGGPTLYAVEMVDERYYWTLPADIEVTDPEIGRFPGFNVTGSNKEKFYIETSGSEDVPYTPREILNELILVIETQLNHGTSLDFDIPLTFTELDDQKAIRDLHAGDQPVGVLIDRVLMATGCYLYALPQNLKDTNNRFIVGRIFEGIQDAKTILETYTDELIGGSMISAPFAKGDNPTVPTGMGAGIQAIGIADLIYGEVPDIVWIHFPQALDGGTGYSVNDTNDTSNNIDYTIDKWHRVGITPAQLSVGGRYRPIDRGDAGAESIFDSYYAIDDGTETGTLKNQAEIDDRALDVALNFYGRYSSGAAELIFRDFIDFQTIPAGFGTVEWSVTEDGIYTRCSGGFDLEVFGHAQMRKRVPNVMGIGGVRAQSRPDGGVVLDAAASTGGADVLAAKITAVNGSVNATYDAVALSDGSIAVTAEAPENRIFFTSDVDFIPRAVDDSCFLVKEPTGPDYKLWVREIATTADCPVPIAGEESGATGIVQGGGLSVNAGDPANFDIQQGVGKIFSYADTLAPINERVVFGPFTNVPITDIATEQLHFIFIDSAGQIVQKAQSAVQQGDYRNNIFLGVLVTTDFTSISFVAEFPNLAYSVGEDWHEFMIRFGPFNENGNVYEPSVLTPTLQLKRSGGGTFLTGLNFQTNTDIPSFAESAAQDPASLQFAYRDGVTPTDAIIVPSVGNVVDPGQWDDGSGTLDSVGNNDWTIQRIYFVPYSGNTVIAYGQEVFNKKSDALAELGVDSYQPPDILSLLTLRYYLVIKGNANDLNDPADAELYEVSAVGSGGGAAVTRFIDLQDTPAAYTGEAGSLTVVDPGETELIFADWLQDTLGNLVPKIDTRGIGSQDASPLFIAVGAVGVDGIEGFLIARPDADGGGARLVGFRDEVPGQTAPGNAPVEIDGSAIYADAGGYGYIVGQSFTEDHYVKFGPTITLPDGRSAAPLQVGPEIVYGQEEFASSGADFDLNAELRTLILNLTITQDYAAGLTTLTYQVQLSEEGGRSTDFVIEIERNAGVVYQRTLTLSGNSQLAVATVNLPIGAANTDSFDLYVTATKSNPNADPWVRGTTNPTRLVIQQASGGGGGVGTNNQSLQPAIAHPDGGATTAFAGNATYAAYLGRANGAYTSVDINLEVLTAWSLGAGGDWAEAAIFSGDYTAGGAGSLSLRGFVDTTAIVNSTGLKTITVPLTGVVSGMDLWIALGSQASGGGTVAQYRGARPDALRSGLYQLLFNTRPSTAPDPVAGLLMAATVRSYEAVAKFV